MADGMMNRARLAASVPQRLEAASPLLRFLAGPHAEAIAAAWPAPHKGFFALPAARRHAAAILLARGERDLAGLANALERHRGPDIARRLLPNGDVSGLMKALDRMGETQWRATDYERFLELFVDPRANRVLRHMAELRPEQLALIHALPPDLREANVVAHTPNLQAARDLALALRLAGQIHEAGVLRRYRRGMLRAKNASSLFDKAANALQPARFDGPAPVPALPAPFEAVRDRAALEKLALAFQNCLRDFIGDMVLGRMAVFHWAGEPPLAVALRWDPAGWRLAEAEAARNEEAPDGALHRVVAALAEAQVRTGPSTWVLAGRLRRHPHGDVESVGEDWRDRLELGHLWD